MTVAQIRNAKLEALRRREVEIKNRIAKEQAKGRKQERTDDTHEKVLIGAAFLADMKIHPETRAAVDTVLKRAITEPRKREFLKTRGWF